MREHGGKRLLIVDNNEQESGALVQLFQSLGHKVSATWSGRDALHYLIEDSFDLVLVDQYIADMYVGRFIERVLNLRNHPRVVIMNGSRKLKPIEYDRSLGKLCVFDKGQPAQAFKTVFPEFSDCPLN